MTRLWILLVILAVGAAAAAVALATRPQAEGAAAPDGARAEAVFAGGCFWCTAADFDKMEGVVSTTSGYIGGLVANPTYAQVSRGDTGHIEAVRVVYDPGRISYAELVARFFPTIDPFDAGGSFCDRGHQYRSAIFPATDEERRIVQAEVARVERRHGQRVATLILPPAEFYPAEDYHQDYYRKNPARYRFYRWNCGREGRLARIWREE